MEAIVIVGRGRDMRTDCHVMNRPVETPPISDLGNGRSPLRSPSPTGESTAKALKL